MIWRFLATYGIAGFGIAAFVLIAMGRLTLWQFFMPLVVTHIVVLISQQVIARPRPDSKKAESRRFHLLLRTYSFPSGHATASACAAMILSTVAPLFSPLFFALALLVGLSRVKVGVHYPTDVAAGFILGLLAGGLVFG